MATMGLSCIVSEIDGDFSRKSQIFPTPCILRRNRTGSWNWVSVIAVKKLESWGYRAEKDVWQYLQPSGYNARTWWTTWQTDTGRQQRPRYNASSGKNNVNFCTRTIMPGYDIIPKRIRLNK